MNKVYWYPDQKGVSFPRKTDPREKSEPGGMPIIPGNYKVLFSYKGKKDSCLLKVSLDPRLDASSFDPEAKYEAMKEFNRSVKAAADAIDNLKKAKKSMELYSKLIELQEDSLKKEMKDLHKDVASSIDSLMNLYSLPPSKKTEYRDSSHTLNSKLRGASRFLRTSTGAPSPNGENAIRKAEKATKEVVDGINDFFETDWNEFTVKLKDLSMDIFEEFENVKIE